MLSYSSNCSIFRANKLETKSTTKKQENLKNGKMRFRLNIDVRKEKEDSRMNAVKTKAKVAFAKVRPTEFEQQQQPMFTLWKLFYNRAEE